MEPGVEIGVVGGIGAVSATRSIRTRASVPKRAGACQRRGDRGCCFVVIATTRGCVLLTMLLAAGGCPAAALPTMPTMDPLADGPEEGCVLERWEDGDTAYVDCGAAEPEIVRLVGIDTAESGFDGNSRSRAQWQSALWKLPYGAVLRCGKAATARVKEICPEGSKVELHGDKLDKYDRLLAHVRCRGQNVNHRLVEEGHAGRYPYPADPEKPRLCQ